MQRPCRLHLGDPRKFFGVSRCGVAFQRYGQGCDYIALSRDFGAYFRSSGPNAWTIMHAY